MKMAHCWCVAVVAGLLAGPAVRAQDFPKPGPEHDVLKKLEGDWDTTMKMGGMESKGTAVYKMDLGGLWLASTFNGDVGGQKFTGKGYDTFNPMKKKYVSVWVDSMSASPMTMEGEYDAAKKTMTMVGEMMGPDGKMAKNKTVSEFKDADTINFGMYVGDEKEPMFTITYKRKK